MSNKALAFEDFILDDYDFNLYTDWDLMDLWEWVELDDFSDIQHAQNAPVHNIPPQQPTSYAQSPQPPPQNMLQFGGANNEISNNDFDDNFDDNITPNADLSQFGIDMDSGGATSGQMPQQMSQQPQQDNSYISTAESDESGDDFDFDFDFDFDDDNTSDNFNENVTYASPPPYQSAPPISTQNPYINNEYVTDDEQSDDTEQDSQHHFDGDDQSDDNDDNDNHDDFDFDFDFDDEPSDINYNTDDGTDLPPPAQVQPQAQPQAQSAPSTESHTESELNDDFDFDFDFSDDDDDTPPTDFNFDDDDDTIGTGGYDNVNLEPETEAYEYPRYITTSAGTLDTHNDDILEHLQQLEFDEFLEVLQNNPHLYDTIMAQDNWSDDEMEFLKSIEPLIKDSDKIAQVRQQKQQTTQTQVQSQAQIKTYTQSDHDAFDTRNHKTLESLYAHLKNHAVKMALNNPAKVSHLPDNLAKYWIQDTQEKQSKRISDHFGGQIAPRNETMPPHIQKNASLIIGKNERQFHELMDIITGELNAMTQSLHNDAIHFIQQDGGRFGEQFNTFLLNKYGTKILFLYLSQMRSDLLADKMFDVIMEQFKQHFAPTLPEDFTQDFFRAIINILQKNNIKL